MSDIEAEIRLLCDAAFGFDQLQADLFLESKQHLFGGKRPSDMIEAGEGQAVKRLVQQMLDGNHL